ncbi:MAG: phage tail tape measure protein [Bacteroidetes bacterium]|nr:phage tail tape measure protein [Bacteroidota bacterium]
MSTRTDIVNLIVNVNGDKGKQQLNDLRKKAADLAFEMKSLAKNTQEYRDKSAELKKVEDQMANMRKQMGLTALSQKELMAELRKLQALKNVTTPQTKEFFELQKQIDAVNNRLYEVKNGVFGFGAALHKVKDEIMKFGILAVGYLGFEFITSQIKSIINGSGKLEDKLADVQRVTGMTKDEVKELNKSLKEIDTRTAQQQLLDYAVTAGKLGVATAEIKAFVQSTDMLVTALGDELGDASTITDNLGKIINVYDGAGKITGERTLQIGNAIVSLANAGVASGGFIVDFTKRLGGLAGTAHIALNSTIGMAAGLEELGQSAETSSTAISTVLVKIGSDVPKFAKLAGKDVKDFAQTLRTAPMEALIQLSEGLKKIKVALMKSHQHLKKRKQQAEE